MLAMKATPEVRKFHDEATVLRISAIHSSRDSIRARRLKSTFSNMKRCMLSEI